MKPFNLKEALAGKPVFTRVGNPVTQITMFDADKEIYKLRGVCCGNIKSWSVNGIWCDGEESEHDLFMAPVKKEHWQNLYRGVDGNIYTIGTAYTSELVAHKFIDESRIHVATVKIYEEEV